MNRRFFFAFLSITLCFFSAYAQPNTPLTSFIQQKTDSLQKAANLPGLFVAVLNNGQRSYHSAGYAIPEQKVPFDSAMVFEAGSITKTFTAYIVESLLHEKGLPDTTSIFPFLPDSVRSNSALASISFRSLLNHTSGLPRLPDNLSGNSLAPYDDYTLAHLFAYLKSAKPKPDGRSNYSNLGAGLAGVLAQRMSGKNFETLLNETIYDPFGLRRANKRMMIRSVAAQGYFNQQQIPFWQMAALAPAGGLQCSADELLTYLQQMGQPSTPSIKIIVEKVLQPTVRVSPTVQVAKGWHTLEQKGKPPIYWHNGGTYGFSTFAAFVPGTQSAVVVVANRFNANATTDAFGMAVMRRLVQ